MQEAASCVLGCCCCFFFLLLPPIADSVPVVAVGDSLARWISSSSCSSSPVLLVLFIYSGGSRLAYALQLQCSIQLCYMMNPPKLLNNHHRRYVGKRKEIIQTQ
jgi:hypothetical protein